MPEQNTINDILNELKRLQVEHGDIPVVRVDKDDVGFESAWPYYNEKQNRIEF